MDKATLDLEQWRFFVLPTAMLEPRLRQRKSIGLTALRQLHEVPLTFDGLGQAIAEAAATHRAASSI